MALLLIPYFDQITRRWTYPLFGLVIALGSPLGLLALRCLFSRGTPVAEEVRTHVDIYLYLLLSTSVVFMALGWLIGSMQDALRLLSLTDPLTGLFNRRHLHGRVVAEVRRTARYGGDVSLLMIDVDGLKTINDAGGHQAGDAAIRAVAQALNATCRASDIVARVGGDEFAILAPSTTAEEAASLAARLRATLAQIPLAPTVSVGISDLGRAGSRTAEALYAAADAAVYEAKESGRDRAVLASPHEPEAVLKKHAALGRKPFSSLARAQTGSFLRSVREVPFGQAWMHP